MNKRSASISHGIIEGIDWKGMGFMVPILNVEDFSGHVDVINKDGEMVGNGDGTLNYLGRIGTEGNPGRIKLWSLEDGPPTGE